MLPVENALDRSDRYRMLTDCRGMFSRPSEFTVGLSDSIGKLA